MNRKIALLAGFPRSGSTLLANLLAQNPTIHATPTSGLSSLLWAVHNQWHSNELLRASGSPDQQRSVLRGVIEGYHANVERPIVIDKCRGWPQAIELWTHATGAKPKVIVTVRNIADVLASLERLWRREFGNPESPQRSPEGMTTLQGRVDIWRSASGVLGTAWNLIEDAVARGHLGCMHFVEYERLCASPMKVLGGVYDFLDEPHFEHSLNAIDQYTVEDDREHGYIDLHTIEPRLHAARSDWKQVLGNLGRPFAQQEIPWV